MTMLSLHLVVLSTCLSGVVSFSTLPGPLKPSSGRGLSPLQVASDVTTRETPPASSKSFAKFDYKAHWYPVAWARDLPLNKPTQVTVFDVDYVIARIDEDEIVAMQDRCPHKSASLSEGRVTKAGNFQCAYHGWTFDGKDGTCVEIPQVVGKDGDMPAITARACGQAVPAMILQGMVWLFPGGSLEQALLAPPPPVVPEMDTDGFSVTTVVRDFPIDWSILLENIMDPDHGLFAHGVLGFDLYSASQDAPQSIQEEFSDNGKGWKITSRVDAVEKLISLDKNRRGKTVKDVEKDKVKVATTTFTAPNHVYMGRRDRETGETTFVTAFWVCPVGTGRSRFMSAAVGKLPISVPRWIMHLSLNNFLDQDTHLLATQQKYVLDAEAQAVTADDDPLKSTNVRKNLYVYRSPTERLGARLGGFWDETLSRAPNRLSTLLPMSQSGVLKQTPSRRVTLDREQQHLRICPDSKAVVRNCNRIRIASVAAGLAVAIIKVAAGYYQSSSWLNRAAALLTPKVIRRSLGLALAAWWLAGKLRREFFFKYTEDFRDRDLTNIPKVWLEH